MAMYFVRAMAGITLGLMLQAGSAGAVEPAEVGKFVNARIEIGEMMTNYFQGGKGYGEGRPPSAEQMAEMGKDINSKMSTLLSKYDMTVDEYKSRSKEVFADDAAVKGYLAEHPDLKKRYEALPFDRMGRGGSSGRGY
jgi:hypothetical protein